MPSQSYRQARLMAAAAHDKSFAQKVGVAQDVARDFNEADAKTGILKKGAPASRKTRYANPRKKMDAANALTGDVLPGG